MISQCPILDSFATDSDSLQHFLFESSNVRGELVHLNNSYLDLMTQHDYPPIIRHLLGEALVAATLIASSLKYAGSVSLQIQGDGPVSLLIAECNHNLEIRGVARWQDDQINTNKLETLFGKGQLVITLSNDKQNERYQGIVELYGNTMSTCIENYFNQSEQLPCRLWIAVSEHSAAGLLLQTLPSATDDREYWQHLLQLTNTITAEELLNLPNEILLNRLYHQENLQIYDPRTVRFSCRCSVERMENALRMMSYEEILELLILEKMIVVTCDFCNRSYQFDQVDIGRIFKGSGIINNGEIQ